MAVDKGKLREMGPEELDKEAASLRAEVWKLRLQASTGQLTDPYKVRRVRKDLARVLTIAREQQLAKRGSDS